jgi:hypothetical protein
VRSHPRSRPVAVRARGGRRDRSRESAVKLHLGAPEVPCRWPNRHLTADGRIRLNAPDKGQVRLRPPVPLRHRQVRNFSNGTSRDLQGLAEPGRAGKRRLPELRKAHISDPGRAETGLAVSEQRSACTSRRKAQVANRTISGAATTAITSRSSGSSMTRQTRVHALRDPIEVWLAWPHRAPRETLTNAAKRRSQHVSDQGAPRSQLERTSRPSRVDRRTIA